MERLYFQILDSFYQSTNQTHSEFALTKLNWFMCEKSLKSASYSSKIILVAIIWYDMSDISDLLWWSRDAGDIQLAHKYAHIHIPTICVYATRRLQRSAVIPAYSSDNGACVKAVNQTMMWTKQLNSFEIY